MKSTDDDDDMMMMMKSWMAHRALVTIMLKVRTETNAYLTVGDPLVDIVL